MIPHYNGEDLLRRCLLSLRENTHPLFSTLVVDNASEDGSTEVLKVEFQSVRFIHSDCNLGFAGGCNLGILSCQTPYVFLLNNDAVVTPGWFLPLLERMEKHPDIAAIQPKIRSIQHPDQFDYCGAAGGEIDVFGYPFARGRIFNTLEQDSGQYDTAGPVFWASGAATLLRRSVLDTVGLFDTAFFAHMEEIDLNWRMQKAGFSIWTEPKSVIRHQTGGTLHQGSFDKMRLNHRNNLLMLLKNYELPTLAWVMPIRILLELMSLTFAILTLQPKWAFAIISGCLSVVFYWPVVQRGRVLNRKSTTLTDRILIRRMFARSIALEYFLFRRRTARQFIGRG